MRKLVYWGLVSTAVTVLAVLAGPGVPSEAAPSVQSVQSANSVQSAANSAHSAKNDATPPMGWNSYNAFACDNGAQNMEAVASFIHTSGLEADGYSTVNSDGCYDDLEGLGSPNTYGVTAPTAQDPETCGAINGRLPDGELFANPYAFPPSSPCANDGFKLVGNDLQALGLNLGVYLDASNNWNCEEIPGSYGFDATDANTLARWGADYVKIDWGCNDATVPPASNAPAGYTGPDAAPGNQGFGGPTFSTNPAYVTGQEQTQTKMYTALVQAIRNEKRPITVSIAGAGTVGSESWGLQLGDLDRPTGDANANFTATGKHAAGSIVGIVNADAETYDALTGPGHWVDPDAMEVGNGSLTPTEDRSEMSMFSEQAQPLLMSTNLCAANCGPDTTPATAAQLALDVSVFGNKQVIAVDQDSLGSPAHIVGNFDGTHLTMAKPLANGDVAVTLFNESTTDAATMSTTAATLGLPAASGYRVEDLWSGATQTTSGAISASVAPTQTVMYRLSPIHSGSKAGPTVTTKPSASTSSISSTAERISGPGTGAHQARPTVSSIPANLLSVSCSSSSLCTGVDNFGGVVTFNPAVPGSAKKAEIASGQSLVSVSCPPASNMCTALDRNGTAFSFNPAHFSLASVRSYSVDRGGEPTAVACVSGVQCTAVDGKGAEVTFDPATGRVNRPGIHAVDPNTYLGALACTSDAQCTAAGGGGNNGDTEVTFDPITGAVGPAGVTSLDSATVNGVSAVSCPSGAECVVVDGSGNEVTFDPATGVAYAAGLVPLEGADLASGLGVMTSVACVSGTQCTVVDDSGNAVTFDPSSGTISVTGLSAVDPRGAGLQSVACFSDSRCAAVDLDGREVTFGSSSAVGTVKPVLVDAPVRWTSGLAS